jgi:hypothetical protein
LKEATLIILVLFAIVMVKNAETIASSVADINAIYEIELEARKNYYSICGETMRDHFITYRLRNPHTKTYKEKTSYTTPISLQRYAEYEGLELEIVSNFCQRTPGYLTSADVVRETIDDMQTQKPLTPGAVFGD